MNRLLPFVAVLVLTVFAQSAFAQGQRRMSPEQMQERIAAQIDETIVALALEGDRAETVKTILTAQAEKRIKVQRAMMEARSSGQGQAGQGNRQGMRESMAELEQETVAMLGDVLTEEELATYAELVASRRGPRRRGNSQIQ